MRSLTWSTSHAAFVTEIDDGHKAIFDALAEVSAVLTRGDALPEIGKSAQRLITCLEAHFAHEERLMRAARYSSRRWHTTAHDHARRRSEQFAVRIEQGDPAAGEALVEYLSSWLHDHTRLADRMLGAFLRNHERFMCKVTFRAGTRPVDSCSWVRVNGEIFDPQSGEKDS